MRHQGNAATALQSINGITPDQVYKLGAEALGWDNSTAEGKALMAEDLELLKRLQLANAMAAADSPPTPYRIGHHCNSFLTAKTSASKRSSTANRNSKSNAIKGEFTTSD